MNNQNQNKKITRFIAEYDNHNDALIAKHPLKSFDLSDFQEEFGIVNPDNQMLAKYPVFESSQLLLNNHLVKPIRWKFLSHSYYLESNESS